MTSYKGNYSKRAVLDGHCSRGNTRGLICDSCDSLDNHSAVFTPGKYCFQVASSNIRRIFAINVQFIPLQCSIQIRFCTIRSRSSPTFNVLFNDDEYASQFSTMHHVMYLSDFHNSAFSTSSSTDTRTSTDTRMSHGRHTYFHVFPRIYFYGHRRISTDRTRTTTIFSILPFHDTFRYVSVQW